MGKTAKGVPGGLAVLDANGDLTLPTVGKGLRLKEGTNARMGTGTLNGTTAVVIATNKVTATSRIFLTVQTPAGTPTGQLWVSTRVPGTSFSVVGIAADQSVFAWIIVEPAP